MKQFLFVVLASLQIAFLILSCEEIVDIDPPAEEPRLVVDGLVRVDPLAPLPPPLRLGIKVSETSAFLGEVPATDLKQITMSGLVLQDSANPGSGFYENLFTARALRQGGDNLLQIQHKDQRYLARGFYMHSAPIDTVYQGDGNSFNDNTEIVIQFKDSINRQNFYLIDFDNGQYMTSSDKLYDGKTQTISFFYDREIPFGTEIRVSLMGIDRSFYNYMNKLIEQSKEEIDLFQTPVSTLRGNIINVTEIDNIDFFDNVDQFDNFALGYYAVAETFTKTLIIE